ncbi:MAG: hypothetical protein VX028_01055 [Nanoarchaeota archaeon]|nr:hypothetical protein [Nanoarchaeota archaeon]MEC8339828.1 hypothetical protein [Nanoarchaeota archaeon]
MKLLSQKAKEYNGKSYYKFWTNINSKYIEQLEWEKGDDLECEIIDNKLIISKKK